MKKALLRSSSYMVGIVLMLIAVPGLRKAAGNQVPQGQTRFADAVGAREKTVLPTTWINKQASNLTVPPVAATRKYYAAAIPAVTAMYQSPKGLTVRAIMSKTSGEPQLLLFFGSALISLAFLLRSWLTN